MRGMRMWGLIVLGVGMAVGVSGCMGIRPPDDVDSMVRKVVVTGYCKCGDCCSWERNWFGRPVYSSGPNKGTYKQVGQTASGEMAKHGTIAADTKLYPFGTVFYVEGYGYGRVEDTGGRVKGQHIDLYFHSHREAQEWGRKLMTVEVWIAPKRK